MTREAELRALLGAPALRGLFRAARDALEARAGERARTVTVAAPSEAERRALADLHGWRELPGPRVRIRLDELDRALRASVAALGLVDALVLLGGPLRDRRDDRRRAAEERDAMWRAARAHVGAAGHPELIGWLDELRAAGLLGRAARAAAVPEATLLAQALAVACRLPAPGTLLAVLASEAAGDAHALDLGRPLAGLVLRAAAALAGWSAVPPGAAERRRLWAAVGVACDPLSTDVLTLGLRPSGAGRLARHLRESSADGEPRRITLRELATASIAVGDARVSVCENPSVVAAAADRVGGRASALVCVEGIPSTAALVLLRELAGGGARVRFRADFDWAGVRIGNLVAAHVPGASAWRFAAADYRRALAEATEPLELAGVPSPAAWDADLAAAMAAGGRAVHEEAMIEVLLADLDAGELGDPVRYRIQ